MNNNSSKQILLSVIGVAILVIAVVGVSFAFFSYVYNGENANTIQTGTIVFSASDSRFTLTNVFPTESAYSGDGKVATVSVEGNTTYEEGIDFIVRAVDVRVKDTDVVPTIAVTTTAQTGVTFSETYAGNTLTDDSILTKGHVAPNTTVSSATPIVTVTAFYDKAKYHISENTKEELIAAGLLTDAFTGTIISPEKWNALTGAYANNTDTDAAAYSFKIQVTATQGTSGRLN